MNGLALCAYTELLGRQIIRAITDSKLTASPTGAIQKVPARMVCGCLRLCCVAAGELSDTEEVRGSNPLAPTIYQAKHSDSEKITCLLTVNDSIK